MNITQGAATQIAGRLMKKGFIRKDKDPQDKRYSVISLTDDGNRVYGEYLEYDRLRSKEITAYLDENFSEEDIRTILRYENLIQDMCRKLS